MKDEEMAEEYVKKEGFRFDMFGELDNITSSEANEEIKQAFLAGLKAGRLQWHNLQKDPNDLPTEEKEYLVYTKEWGVEIRGYFADDKFFSCRKNMVVAWCELPTFDKE